MLSCLRLIGRRNGVVDHAVYVLPAEKPELPKFEARESSATGLALHGFWIAVKDGSQFTDVQELRVYCRWFLVTHNDFLTLGLVNDGIGQPRSGCSPCGRGAAGDVSGEPAKANSIRSY
jgi:hypothetical protein